MRKRSICGIDIGSSKIAGCLAHIDKNGKIQDFYLHKVPSRGINKGAVSNIVELSDCLSGLCKHLEKKGSIKVNNIFVSTSGKFLKFYNTNAVMLLIDRGNKVINSFDLKRVEDYAKNLNLKYEEEFLHSITQYYILDDDNRVLNPLGLYGRKLDLHSYFIVANTSHIQNLKESLEQSGLQAEEILFSGLASSKACLSLNDKQNCIYLDIGSDLTEFLLFKDGIVQYIDILDIGGRRITDKISIELKLSCELAEEIKLEYGSAVLQKNSNSNEILIKKDGCYKTINKDIICNITREAAKEILLHIDKKMKKINYSGIDRIVIIGKTAILDGFLEMAEAIFGLPVRMGLPKNLPINLNPNNIDYATSIGLVFFGLDSHHEKMKYSLKEYFAIPGLLNKLKLIYQDYF